MKAQTNVALDFAATAYQSYQDRRKLDAELREAKHSLSLENTDSVRLLCEFLDGDVRRTPELDSLGAEEVTRGGFCRILETMGVNVALASLRRRLDSPTRVRRGARPKLSDEVMSAVLEYALEEYRECTVAEVLAWSNATPETLQLFGQGTILHRHFLRRMKRVLKSWTLVKEWMSCC
jgi:hypothetical protein